MKDFEKEIKATLKNREAKKCEELTKNLAEEVICTAIKMFEETDVKSVHIAVFEKVTVYSGKESKRYGEDERYKSYDFWTKTFEKVKNILESEISKIEPYIHVSVDGNLIELKLKE